MPFVNIPNSKLVPSISTLVGRLEGQVVSKVEGVTNKIQRDLEQSTLLCREAPTRKLNGLLQQTGKVKNTFNRIKPLTNVLRRAARALSRILRILKALPIPGFSLTAGITTTFSDTLHLVKEFSAQLNEDAEGIDTLIGSNGATQFIDSLEGRVRNLLTLVDLNCRFEQIQDTILTGEIDDPSEDEDEELSEDEAEVLTESIVDEEDIEDFRAIIARAASKENIDSEVGQLQGILSKYGDIVESSTLPSEDRFQDFQENFTGLDGRQFVLEIITLSPTFTLAIQRQAIAKDVVTREVLFSGSPSFASNPDILIEELKFKINTSV